MNSQLDTECLKANKLWTAISIITPRKAIEDAAAGAVKLIKFVDGYPLVLSLDEWLKLDASESEDYISISRTHGLHRIPVPRACICTHYDKYRAKAVPFNLRNLAKRYNYTCAVTGKALREDEYSREHVLPRSMGGASGWGNEVLMDRKRNNNRGNKSYADAGLMEPIILGEPAPLLPVHAIQNTRQYPEWDLFLPKNKD